MQKFSGHLKQKSPDLRGFQGGFETSQDGSGPIFWREGGIRTHGTLRYA